MESAIPLSPGHYNRSTNRYDFTAARLAELEELAAADGVDLSHSTKWREQPGSLGGGNHFIELCIDEDDRVWLFLHSGSRGVGNKIATHHIGVARRVAERYWIDLPDRDLAYLAEGTDAFWAYLRQLRWAQRFALLNREEMMDRVLACVAAWVGTDSLERVAEVNCHHNYTESERHFGKQVWLSRKGAIDASAGTWGLIPGSMGTASYVVVGKGNTAMQGGPTVTAMPDSVVIDDDFNIVQPGSGVVGKVARKGNIPLGYYKDEKKTAETFITGPDGTRYAVPGDFATVEAVSYTHLTLPTISPV